MKKLIKFKPEYLLIITFLLAFTASFFQLNPAIDTGRELYIPFRMINGEVLYRDIVNIYGPLAYQLNALLYLIFGATLTPLRIAGIFNSTLIIWIFMLICGEIFPLKNQQENTTKSEFTGEKGYWQLAVIPLITGVCSLGTFNYTLPYSFSMTYGLTAFLASVLFFIKFAQNDEPKFAYLACLFAGCAIACKYDFFLYAIFLALYILVNKKISTINVLASFACFAIIPAISFGILFMQGMKFFDLQETFALVNAISHTHSLKYFYSNFTGACPSISILSFGIVKTLLLIAIGAIVTFAKTMCKSDKFLIILVGFFGFTGLIYVGFSGYSLIAIINALIFCIFLKKIYTNKPLYIFMCASILFSFKTFFAVNMDVYGTYTAPLILLSIGAFLYNADYCSKKELKTAVNTFFSMLLAGLLILCGIKSIMTIIPKSQGFLQVTTTNTNNSGNKSTNGVFAYPQVANTLNTAIAYIEKNTKETDKIVVVPETMYINFVTGRPADNIFDSLTPMYFETFGEEFVINHFSQTKPEYFILNNRDTYDYGKRFICDDYGKQFCQFVKENYKNTETFGEGKYVMQLYKRNDL